MAVDVEGARNGADRLEAEAFIHVTRGLLRDSCSDVDRSQSLDRASLFDDGQDEPAADSLSTMRRVNKNTPDPSDLAALELLFAIEAGGADQYTGVERTHHEIFVVTRFN